MSSMNGATAFLKPQFQSHPPLAANVDAPAHLAGLPGVACSAPPDREIYAQGEPVRAFYKVVRGLVRTCSYLTDGRRQIDAFYAEGEFFGLEPGPTHALCAEAASACTLVSYRWKGFDAAANTPVAKHLYDHAMQALGRAQYHALLLGRMGAAQKLAAFLLDLAARNKTPGPVEIEMTRQDIADYLGLTIETVSRSFSRMEQDGLITLPAPRRVVIRNRAMLEELRA